MLQIVPFLGMLPNSWANAIVWVTTPHFRLHKSVVPLGISVRQSLEEELYNNTINSGRSPSRRDADDEFEDDFDDEYFRSACV